MHDDHRFNMEENARKQTEKEEVDNQRLMDLQAEMEQQLRRFEAIMSEVYMEHEKLMEKMNRDFQLEKDDLEHRKKELSAKIEQMLA